MALAGASENVAVSKHVLVTGANGFIGSRFVQEAVSQGHRVTVLDRPGCVWDRVEPSDAVSRVEMDVSDAAALESVLGGVDVVVHFAWSGNPAMSWEHPDDEVERNLRPTVALFESAARAGVQRLVFPSSGGTVYGPSAEALGEEAPTFPFNPYGIAKLSAEHFLRYVGARFDVNWQVYRIGNAYGPGARLTGDQGVIGIWMRQLRDGEPLRAFGDHETRRDYIATDDLAALMMYSLRDFAEDGVFNLGTGRGVTIPELLTLVQAAAGREGEVVWQERRSLDNQFVVLDPAKIVGRFPGFTFRQLEDELPRVWASVCEAGPA